MGQWLTFIVKLCYPVSPGHFILYWFTLSSIWRPLTVLLTLCPTCLLSWLTLIVIPPRIPLECPLCNLYRQQIHLLPLHVVPLDRSLTQVSIICAVCTLSFSLSANYQQGKHLCIFFIDITYTISGAWLLSQGWLSLLIPCNMCSSFFFKITCRT